jgi:hypothetical protein
MPIFGSEFRVQSSGLYPSERCNPEPRTRNPELDS